MTKQAGALQIIIQWHIKKASASARRPSSYRRLYLHLTAPLQRCLSESAFEIYAVQGACTTCYVSISSVSVDCNLVGKYYDAKEVDSATERAGFA